jgi:dimethylglycine dehydrogenase
MRIASSAAPAHGGASVMSEGRVVGTVTSGDWGHRLNMNLAYAFIEPDLAVPGQDLTIDIIGELQPAQVIESGPYDPDYARIRS